MPQYGVGIRTGDRTAYLPIEPPRRRVRMPGRFEAWLPPCPSLAAPGVYTLVKPPFWHTCTLAHLHSRLESLYQCASVQVPRCRCAVCKCASVQCASVQCAVCYCASVQVLHSLWMGCGNWPGPVTGSKVRVPLRAR